MVLMSLQVNLLFPYPVFFYCLNGFFQHIFFPDGEILDFQEWDIDNPEPL